MKRNGTQSTLDSFFNIPKRLAVESTSGESSSTDNMASNQPVYPGTSTGRGECKYRGIRSLREVDPENHARLAEELATMGSHFVRRLNGKSWESTSRFFSDVFVYNNDRERLGMEQLLSNAGANYRRSLFWFVTDIDANHIHLIHDCAFSNRSCRCAWRGEIIAKFPGAVKQAIGKRRFISQFTVDDWLDVFIYYCLRKWGKPQKIWFDGENQGLPTPSESLRWEEMQRESAEILAGANGGFSNNLFEEGQGIEESSSNVARSGWINVRAKTTKFDTTIEKVQALLEKYPTWPIRGIRSHEEFRQDRNLINPRNMNDVNAAIDDFGVRIMNYTMRDFYTFYTRKGCEPIFRRSDTYMGIEESVEVINDLLKFQFDDDEDNINEFLNTLVAVFERKIPKLNTLVLHSPPSSGKTFFMDMLFSISLNTGGFTTANKHFPFAYQEGVNRRVIMWDEPNYSSDQLEILKKICGGFTVEVNVKNKGYGEIERTPLFVTTNDMLSIMYMQEFSDRVKTYTWKPAIFLKECEHKPNPMSLFPLLIKYNIDF